MKIIAAVLLVSLVSAPMLVSGPASAQEDYPTRPIRFISPYGPGGGNDTMARLIGQKLTEVLNQQVIVDNRPGANTIIGTDIVAKSRPDGYTFLFSGISTFVINALLVPTPYDTVQDFQPIAALGSTDMIMVMHPSLPANNLKELIALAKAKPGTLNYATSSAGGLGHLAGELFNVVAGLKLQHIPYKGTNQALNDVLGGQVELCISSMVSTVPHLKSGRLKAVALLSDARNAALPNVPTFAESGMPEVEAKVVYGILAAARTPRARVAKMAGEIEKIQRTADFREKLTRQGVDPFILGPDRFETLIRSDMKKFGKIVKMANVKLK